MPVSDFRPFPQHPAIYDRSKLKPSFERPYFLEGNMAQAAEFNEAISQINSRAMRVNSAVLLEGDRIKNAEISAVEGQPGEFDLAAGSVYVRGDIREVAYSRLTGVPVVGDAIVGVRVVETLITAEDDPDLYGLHQGTEGEGEPGAIRQSLSLVWGHSADALPGDLIAVYHLRNGQVIDQAPPPEASGIMQQIAKYDYGAHENYIDEGCRVDAVGSDGSGNQVFMIAEGIANILGYKRYRESATRFVISENPQTMEIPAEVHTYTDSGGFCTINVYNTPINAIQSVLVQKVFTETIVRGNPANTSDLLTKTGVVKINSVVQGGTTYVANTSYVLSGNSISWAAGGPEPAVASSYDVTYEYLDLVTPDQITNTSFRVAGGVTGGQVQVAYSFKLPRVDRICFDVDGNVVYLEGISVREQPQPPIVPHTLLALAEIHNTWDATPTVVNNGIRNFPYWQIDKMWRRLIDLLDLMGLERLSRDISAREPNAKHEVFVDPFTSDRYRDEGETQNGAVFLGTLQLPITPSFIDLSRPDVTLLDYTEETVVRQEYSTNCHKINEYQNFRPLPLTLTITPSEDFWTERNEAWSSPVTQVFGQGSQSRVVSDTVVTSEATRAAEFLRQIQIEFQIGGLVPAEPVNVLTFAGVDVKPGTLVGDSNGQCSGVFTIPVNVPAGVQRVYAEATAGRSAAARFEGRGVITDVNRQRVTQIQRWDDPPPAATAVVSEPDAPRRVRQNQQVGERDTADPIAQTFSLTENRHITSVDVRFCNIGDRSKPVVCEIVTVENGIPTRDVIAQAELNMLPVLVNTWTKFTFDVPQFIAANQEHAFVFKTDDANHALSTAVRGGFDVVKNEIIGAQPYTVGVMLSSSNASTWTPHQDEDMTMRINCAIFNPTTKVVDLGDHAVTNMSDLICMANTFLPTEQTMINFRVTPAGQDPVILEIGQNWERTSYFTGTMKVEVILYGGAKVSPILGRNILAIPGALQSPARYVSKAFAMGTAVRQDVRLKTKLPTGSTCVVKLDKKDDNFTNAPLAETEILQNGDQDRRYTIDPWTAATGGRVEITLTGTPSARPAVSDLRAYSI